MSVGFYSIVLFQNKFFILKCILNKLETRSMTNSRDSIKDLLKYYCSTAAATSWDNKVVFCDGLEHFISCIQFYSADRKPSNQIIYNSKTGKVSAYTVSGKTYYGEIDVVDLILDWIPKQ
jgi:hypothetical protein